MSTKLLTTVLVIFGLVNFIEAASNRKIAENTQKLLAANEEDIQGEKI